MTFSDQHPSRKEKCRGKSGKKQIAGIYDPKTETLRLAYHVNSGTWHLCRVETCVVWLFNRLQVA